MTLSHPAADDDVIDDVLSKPHTPPLLWQRTGPHTTLSWQPSTGTRSRTSQLVSAHTENIK